MPKRVPIKTAKYVADRHNLQQVLLIGYDGERVHVVTYGKTKAACAQAAKAQDFWAGKIREFSFEGDNLSLVRVDRVACAIWNDRVQRCALLGIVLEPWGDGTIPRANGVFEEAIAAIKAM